MPFSSLFLVTYFHFPVLQNSSQSTTCAVLVEITLANGRALQPCVNINGMVMVKGSWRNEDGVRVVDWFQ